MEQSQHFDVAALLSCLYQLRQENEQVRRGAGWWGGDGLGFGVKECSVCSVVWCCVVCFGYGCG